MKYPALEYAKRVAETTHRVFGDGEITAEVLAACEEFERAVEQITDDRGVKDLLIAVVGAKKQGKSWVVRQLIHRAEVRDRIPIGDLHAESTRKLFWISQVAPYNLNPLHETHLVCRAQDLADLGQPYALLDTPGITDADAEMASLAADALSLAAVKLLVLARDQIRAAVNLNIGESIDGAVCIPVITMIPPEELGQEGAQGELVADLKALERHLAKSAPDAHLTAPVLVPNFDISGDEPTAGQSLVAQLRSRMAELNLSASAVGLSKNKRIQSAQKRFKERVRQAIIDAVPRLRDSTSKLDAALRRLPEEVLVAALGDRQILEIGVRFRLLLQFISDTWPIWLPYRTAMVVLVWTTGAWDRLLLAFTGSLPSLFGTLVAGIANFKQARDALASLQDGIRSRIEKQIAAKLQPACEDFHLSLLRVRSGAAASDPPQVTPTVRLLGLDELQSRSQEVFHQKVKEHATRPLVVQLAGLLCAGTFWALFSGPVVLIYGEYIRASNRVLTGDPPSLSAFPHPTWGLLMSSMILSLLPMLIVCMLILTLLRRRPRIEKAANAVYNAHKALIHELMQNKILRISFEDQLLRDAQFLLSVGDEQST